MPKKRDGEEKYSRALAAFFSDIYDAVRKFIDFDIVKVVLCGSPGEYGACICCVGCMFCM